MVSNPFGEPLTVVLEADTSGLEGGIKGAISRMSTLQKAAAGAGVGLAALSAKGIASTVRAAGDLDAALKESQAIMGDLTNKQMAGMEEAAREVGRTTTFSADEAGSAFYYLASAGMDAEQSMAAIGDVAQFAQAGAFDLATATDLSTDALTSLGMAAEDPQENLKNLNRVQDVFVRANELANASVEQYAQAMTNKLGPAMRAAGMEIEEGTAALSVFADAGLKGRRAGTILTRTIEGLQDGARENAAAFEELGIQVFDAQGEMRPLQSIVSDAEDAFSGMSTEQRAAAMEQLGFNQRSRQGMEILLGQSDALGEYQTELESAGGATERVAEKQLESFNNQIELLKSQFQDIAIEIGGVFLPYLTQLVKAIGVVVGWFAEFNSKTNGVAGAVTLLAGLFGGLIVAGGAIVSMMGGLSAVLAPVLAGLGALTTVIGALLTPIATAASIIGTLVAVINPLTIVIGGLIAIVVTLAAMWTTNFGGIRDQTMRVVNVLKEEFGPAIEWLRGVATTILNQFGGEGSAAFSSLSRAAVPLIKLIADGLIVAIRGLAAVMRAFVSGATVAWNALGPVITSVLTTIQIAINEFMAWFGPIWRETMGPIMDEAAKTWSVWSQIVTYTLNTIRTNINAFLTWLAPYWNAYWTEFNAQFKVFANEMRQIWAIVGDDVIATARFVWDLVSSIVRGGLTLISGILRTIAAVMRADWSTAWNIIHQTTVDIVSGIGAFVLKWGERFVYRIGEIVLGVIDWFRRLGKELIWGSLVPRMLGDIKSAFSNFGRDVVRWISNFVSNFVRRIQNWASRVTTTWRNGLTRMYRTLGSVGKKIVSRMSSIANSAVQRVKNVGGKMYRAGRSIIQSIVNGVNRKKNAVKRAVANVVGKAARFLPWSDAEEGPFSNLSESGPGLVQTLAQGVREEGGRLSAAVREMVAGARAFLPRSDADTGPLSDLREAGRSFGTTFAEGIRSSESEVTAAANSLAGAARGALGGAETRTMIKVEDGSWVDPSFFGWDAADIPDDATTKTQVKTGGGWVDRQDMPGRQSPLQTQTPNISAQFDSLAQSNRKAIQRLEGEMADRLDALITHAKNSEGVVRIDGKKAGEVIEGSMHRKRYSTEIYE